jgi:hypothetical protein
MFHELSRPSNYHQTEQVPKHGPARRGEATEDDARRCFLGHPPTRFTGCDRPIDRRSVIFFVLLMTDLINCLHETAQLSALHAKIQNLNPDPTWYSNPLNATTLPFPFIYDQLPGERFCLSESDIPEFTYLGREKFSSLWERVECILKKGAVHSLFMQGPKGLGKSHLLAALACLWSRMERRTVYIPDCRQALSDPLFYLQIALLCAFADPSSASKRTIIRSFQSTDDLKKFCRALTRPLYFVIDQVNALEHEDSNEDIVSNEDKDNFQRLLRYITIKGYVVKSASANYLTALRMEQKQSGEDKLQMMGGMSPVNEPSIRFSSI